MYIIWLQTSYLATQSLFIGAAKAAANCDGCGLTLKNVPRTSKWKGIWNMQKGYAEIVRREVARLRSLQQGAACREGKAGT